MPILFTLTLVTGLILVANRLAATKNETYNKAFDWLLLFINLSLALLGIMFTQIPESFASSLQYSTSVSLENLRSVGLTFLAVATWGAVMSIRSVRQALAGWLPLNPGSPVHALALVMCGYLGASAILALTQGGLEVLAASAAPTTLSDLLLQFLLFLSLALLGTGLLTRRSFEALRVRLGLERPTKRQLVVGVRWVILLVVVQWIFGMIGALMNPGQFELLDDISASLLDDIDTVWEWLVLALSTGVGEEILFRGALQPVLGMKFTAVIFAVAHVQYGISPITLAVFIIGIALGHIRRQSNTTVAIFVHASYNFTLGLLALLATYLQGVMS